MAADLVFEPKDRQYRRMVIATIHSRPQSSRKGPGQKKNAGFFKFVTLTDPNSQVEFLNVQGDFYAHHGEPPSATGLLTKRKNRTLTKNGNC